MKVCVETGALIALHEPRDANDAAAGDLVRELLRDGVTLVTGWHALVEFVDGLAHRYGQARAAQTLERILASPRLRTLETDRHIERAVAMFNDRTDWDLDLSDCLSFATMEAEGIVEAFPFDRDFDKAGLTRLPRPSQ